MRILATFSMAHHPIIAFTIQRVRFLHSGSATLRREQHIGMSFITAGAECQRRNFYLHLVHVQPGFGLAFFQVVDDGAANSILVLNVFRTRGQQGEGRN